jgi:hypothetical protein
MLHSENYLVAGETPSGVPLLANIFLDTVFTVMYRIYSLRRMTTTNVLTRAQKEAPNDKIDEENQATKDDESKQ